MQTGNLEQNPRSKEKKPTYRIMKKDSKILQKTMKNNIKKRFDCRHLQKIEKLQKSVS